MTEGTQRDNMIDMARKGRSTNAKLNKSDVIEIRKLRAEGKSFRKIGEMFGVTKRVVMLIERGERYSYFQ